MVSNAIFEKPIFVRRYEYKQGRIIGNPFWVASLGALCVPVSTGVLFLRFKTNSLSAENLCHSEFFDVPNSKVCLPDVGIKYDHFPRLFAFRSEYFLSDDAYTVEDDNIFFEPRNSFIACAFCLERFNPLGSYFFGVIDEGGFRLTVYAVNEHLEIENSFNLSALWYNYLKEKSVFSKVDLESDSGKFIKLFSEYNSRLNLIRLKALCWSTLICTDEHKAFLLFASTKSKQLIIWMLSEMAWGYDVTICGILENDTQLTCMAWKKLNATRGLLSNGFADGRFIVYVAGIEKNGFFIKNIHNNLVIDGLACNATIFTEGSCSMVLFAKQHVINAGVITVNEECEVKLDSWLFYLHKAGSIYSMCSFLDSVILCDSHKDVLCCTLKDGTLHTEVALPLNDHDARSVSFGILRSAVVSTNGIFLFILHDASFCMYEKRAPTCMVSIYEQPVPESVIEQYFKSNISISDSVDFVVYFMRALLLNKAFLEIVVKILCQEKLWNHNLNTVKKLRMLIIISRFCLMETKRLEDATQLICFESRANSLIQNNHAQNLLNAVSNLLESELSDFEREIVTAAMSFSNKNLSGAVYFCPICSNSLKPSDDSVLYVCQNGHGFPRYGHTLLPCDMLLSTARCFICRYPSISGSFSDLGHLGKHLMITCIYCS